MRKRKAQKTNQAIMRGVIAMALIVLLVCYLFLTLVSCSPAKVRFHVSGSISDAKDSTLVLEAMTLSGIQPLDSVRLSEEGSFSFAVAPTTQDSVLAPDFFRLRIGSQVINFCVDSLEDIFVTAPAQRMATDYDIQGNEASRTMKTISLLNLQLQQQFRKLNKQEGLSSLEKAERARQLVDTYKHRLKTDFILRDPASPAAYYALFQTIGGQMLFNPETDKSDVQFIAAVATQWDELYPGAQRTENLCNIALRGLRNTRQSRPRELVINSDKVREIGIIDFGFPDLQGEMRRLSDFPENVILLDFTAYSLPQSQQRMIDLRSLYTKYHKRGLEIYQVSLDADEHYWKTMCEQLPWICVHCEEGFANDMVQIYGVRSLPAIFLIGRGSELKARGEDITDLQKAIENEL